MEHESDGDTNCNWCTRFSHQRIDKGTGGFGNKRTRGDQSNYIIIITIDQNPERSPGDIWRLAVIQTPGRNHQQMLM